MPEFCPQCEQLVDSVGSHSCRYAPFKGQPGDVVANQCHSPTCTKKLPHVWKSPYCGCRSEGSIITCVHNTPWGFPCSECPPGMADHNDK